jgi:tRNA threonylcarbamoyladenosine biosynthesis protein TsaB
MLLAIDTSTARIGLALYDGTSVPGEFSWHSGLHHTQELAPALAELLRLVDIKIGAVKAIGVALGPGSFTSLRVGLAFAKGLVLARHIPVIGISTLDIVAAAVPISGPSTGSLMSALPSRTGVHRIASLMPPVFAYPDGQARAARTVSRPPAPVASAQAGQRRRLVAVVQAGRGRLAFGWYSAEENEWQADGPAMVATADELAEKIHKPVIVCGEMSADERQRLGRKFKNVTLASPAQCVRRPGILAELAWKKWQSGKIDSAAALAPIYLHMSGGLPA